MKKYLFQGIRVSPDSERGYSDFKIFINWCFMVIIYLLIYQINVLNQNMGEKLQVLGYSDNEAWAIRKCD